MARLGLALRRLFSILQMSGKEQKSVWGGGGGGEVKGMRQAWDFNVFGNSSLQAVFIVSWASTVSLPAVLSASQPSIAEPNSPTSARHLSTWLFICAYVLCHVRASNLSRCTVARPITSASVSCISHLARRNCFSLYLWKTHISSFPEPSLQSQVDSQQWKCLPCDEIVIGPAQLTYQFGTHQARVRCGQNHQGIKRRGKL